MECQDLCNADAACVGILYDYNPDHGDDRHCCICYDDVLTSLPNYFGFYRKPGKISRGSKVVCVSTLITILSCYTHSVPIYFFQQQSCIKNYNCVSE